MKKFSLNAKIAFVLTVAILGSVIISAVGIYNMSAMNQSITQITGQVMPRISNSYRAQSSFRQMAISQSSLIMADTKEEMAEVHAILQEKDKEFRKNLEEYKAFASEGAKPFWVKTQEAYEAWWAKATEGQAAALAGNDKLAVAFNKEQAKIRKGAEATLTEMIAFTEKNLDEQVDTMGAAYINSRNTIIAASICSMLFALILGFLIMRATGAAIRAVVQILKEGSFQVSSAAQQIASSSEQLSQAATEQAASLEETAASVEEMNSMVAKNSENANAAATTSSKSREAVNQGKRVIEKMIESMNAINRSSEGMADVVKVIEQIDKKTKVINEIVNKTELLSFNASVEAARAGEHGKGFAVVAEEVGNLARMSGTAAEEIAALLESSISKVNQMVTETKKNVETGSQVTHECGEVFEEVVQNVTSVSGMATEIASASQEQSRGCSEITKAMNQLDQMTQQNAATSEECASASEGLSTQAESLKGAVMQLVMTINGENSTDSFTEATTAKVKKATYAPKPSSKVVHIGSKAPKVASSREPVLKRTGNDAPQYDSEGFQDV